MAGMADDFHRFQPVAAPVSDRRYIPVAGVWVSHTGKLAESRAARCRQLELSAFGNDPPDAYRPFSDIPSAAANRQGGAEKPN